MTHAYNESYLYDAKENLAECFDYALLTCQLDADLFTRLWLQSGYAEKFERGNPAIIAGMSGIELAQRVILYAFPTWEFPSKRLYDGRSAFYWAGWALAEYQWTTRKRFKDIFSRVPLSEIIDMYPLYHEIELQHFIEGMNQRYDTVILESKLKTIRKNRGVSQADLAKLSGVKLRSIQMYEQKVNDIDKAQAQTLYKLSRVLGCTIEDLLENPEA